jgi:hypothetical protein
MTKETAQFLFDLLNRQQLAVGAPDFEVVTAQVLTARSELLAILAGPAGNAI